MAINVGDVVPVQTTFTVGGVETDPTLVVLTVRAPDGTQTTPATTNPSVGVYKASITADQAGIWHLWWTGTGAVVAVEPDSFEVEAVYPAGDLTTLDSVKQSMVTTSDDSDDLIRVTITAASRAIAEWTAREFVQTGAETRIFEVRDYWLRSVGMRAEHGIPVGDLAAAPTAVVLHDVDDDVVTTYDVATELVYLPLYRSAWDPITHIRPRTAPADWISNYVLRVTGRWGFPAIPPDVAQACIVTVRSWLRRDSSAWADIGAEDPRLVSPVPPGGWMLPTAAKQLLRSYRTPVLA